MELECIAGQLTPEKKDLALWTAARENLMLLRAERNRAGWTTDVVTETRTANELLVEVDQAVLDALVREQSDAREAHNASRAYRGTACSPFV